MDAEKIKLGLWSGLGGAVVAMYVGVQLWGLDDQWHCGGDGEGNCGNRGR